MTLSLQGFCVMVTRPRPEGEQLCAQIEKWGGKTIFFPTIAIVPPTDTQPLRDKIALLEEPNWLIFTSPQAVYAAAALIRERWAQLPATLSVAAIGQGTAHLLQAGGFSEVIYPPREWSSEGLVRLPVFQFVHGQHIVLLKGLGGRDMLAQWFATKGAHVTECITYQRVLPSTALCALLPLLKAHEMDVIVCTSAEGLRNLRTLCNEIAWPLMCCLPLVVASERIKSLARDLGFQTIWTAENAGHEAIIEVLRKGLNHDR
jgi:uroporphyrinogen-III synthase